MNASIIETISSTEIEVGINDLSRIIPLVRSLVVLVYNAAFVHQTTHGSINLCEVTASKSGSQKTSAAANTLIKQFHTDNDSTYIVINVPEQAKVSKGNDIRKYIFF